MNQPIRNSIGERLDYSFASGDPSNKRKGWIVVLGHGVTGNKDRPVVADTTTALNTSGFDTLRFSFAGNGDSEGDFREATVTKEVGDLGAVLDALAPSYPKIAYIGHSMGAAVGVLRASFDDRIRLLVSLAGMVDTKTFAETEFGSETPDKGVMWEDDDCPLSATFMVDLCRNVRSVESQAREIKVPWLLLHGTADDVVLPRDSETVARLRGDTVRLVRIEGADHSFTEPAHKLEMTRTVADWLAARGAEI